MKRQTLIALSAAVILASCGGNANNQSQQSDPSAQQTSNPSAQQPSNPSAQQSRNLDPLPRQLDNGKITVGFIKKRLMSHFLKNFCKDDDFSANYKKK